MPREWGVTHLHCCMDLQILMSNVLIRYLAVCELGSSSLVMMPRRPQCQMSNFEQCRSQITMGYRVMCDPKRRVTSKRKPLSRAREHSYTSFVSALHTVHSYAVVPSLPPKIAHDHSTPWARSSAAGTSSP
jgi:hypothetical protein